MKAGKEYELLIDKLYRELEPNAIVTFDDKIYDPRAQIDRQIDVSIRYKFAGVDHLIIVQAKDHKRKADVAVVDLFQTVIRDTNANKGILISVSGFSKSAINKAKSYGIECLSIHSALNKKWETVLKIPVQKEINEFTVEYDFLLNVGDKLDQNAKILDQSFSYDKLNIIYLSHIAIDHIIKKYDWNYIKKGKKIRIDLEKIELYHSYNNLMLPIHNGFIEVTYKKSHFSKFYITPSNYIYEANHTNETKSLHNLVITEEILDDIISKRQINDPSLVENPMIFAKVYKFNTIHHTILNFDIPRGGIMGDFLAKGNTIIKNDAWGSSIAELEDKLKNNKAI